MPKPTTKWPALTPAELRARRERLGLSPEELASLLYLSHATVRHWETGRRAIPPYATRLLEWAELTAPARQATDR